MDGGGGGATPIIKKAENMSAMCVVEFEKKKKSGKQIYVLTSENKLYFCTP